MVPVSAATAVAGPNPRKELPVSRNRSKTCRKARNAAFRRQNGRCYYCNCPMWLGDCREFATQYALTMGEARRLRCTAEHLKARKDGGPDAAANIVAACDFCNRSRHRRAKPLPPDRFEVLVRQRVRAGRWHGG